MNESIVLLICTLASPLLAEKLESQDELYIGKEYSNAFYNPVDNPDLPNVLVIGDSISIGYTIEVREILKGKADVYRIRGNAKHSSYGLQNIEKWVAKQHFDIIHFNWGLWDICYRSPEAKTPGHRDKKNGTLTITPEVYKSNLEAIVKKLTNTKAKLIWAETTPVPSKEAGRKVGDSIKYNLIASEIMSENNVRINNLHSYAFENLDKIQIAEGDVHFTKEGYSYLAKKVAKEIEQMIKAD